MKAAFISLLSLTGLTAVSAAAVELPREFLGTPREGYAVVPLTWTGPINADGKNYTFQGSAEAILAQIETLNPDFKAFVDSQTPSNASLSTRGLEARVPTRVACDGGGPNGGRSSRTRVDDARQGIGHLRWLAGGSCGAWARSCARMTCNNGAEIWFCNDNDRETSDRCDYQAYLAELAIDRCQVHIKGYCWVPNPHCGDCGCADIDEWIVMGAQYDDRNWNIMITNGPRNWNC